MMPSVSVILATYDRPDVLKLAISSVVAQDLQDWELIVVGDHCSPSTGEAVASFDDPRIRYINMPANFGEQSGPNNVGLARARGSAIAYLNHDDLWFPDHLSAALAWMEAAAADVVVARAAVVRPAERDQYKAGEWRVVLLGAGTRGRYDPTSTVAYASSLVFRAAAARRIGAWKAAAECHGESSQELVFRAWRSGCRVCAMPHLTVIMLHSGKRRLSYMQPAGYEHGFFPERLKNTNDLRLRLLERAERAPATNALGQAATRRALLLIARFGLSPRELRFRWQSGYRRGALIDRLRHIRGLPLRRDDLATTYLAEAPAYRLGTDIDLGAKGTGRMVKAEGWAPVAAEGSEAVGTPAVLQFRFTAPLKQAVILECAFDLVALAYGSPPGRAVVVEVSVEGVVVDRWQGALGNAAEIRRARIEAGHLRRRTTVRIGLALRPVSNAGWASRPLRSAKLLVRRIKLSAEPLPGVAQAGEHA